MPMSSGLSGMGGFSNTMGISPRYSTPSYTQPMSREVINSPIRREVVTQPALMSREVITFPPPPVRRENFPPARREVITFPPPPIRVNSPVESKFQFYIK